MIDITSRSVIVAESSPLIAKAIAEAFGERGFEVIACVPDGVSALRLARLESPGIVTLDLVLPRLSGLRLADSLSSLPNPPTILAISAVTARARIAQAKAAGVQFYLLKPVAEDQLRMLIERNWEGPQSTMLAQ